MSVRGLSLRKMTWIASLSLVVIGGVIGAPSFSLGAEAIPIREQGETSFKKNQDQPYTYQAGTRRDPFVPLPQFQSREDSTVPALAEPDTTEDVLRVLGIILGKRGYQALLHMPNGEHLMVEPGSLLENTSLTVKRITNDSVLIAQPLEGKGDSRILETTLFLSD